ncbi:MAG: hypothetical protein H6628_17600 [Calditrichae bacterium]|nr:hypothetical protein [Calditrichia bacterium]
MITDLEEKKKFIALLDERQKRLFAGMEAQALGRDGVRLVSEAFGMHPNTVRRGKAEFAELDASSLPKGRARQTGGGRKKRSTSSRS